MTLQQKAERMTALAKAADPGRALAEAVEEGRIKTGAILKAVGIDPGNPMHQAALLIAQRYDMDPLLKHVLVLPQGGPYITRDGYLHVAHRSGQLDGIEVVSETDDGSHYEAKVAVWRKDMGRPFTFTGRAAKNERNARDMALARAERRALKRAFNISGDTEPGDDVQPLGQPPIDVAYAPLTPIDAPDTPAVLDVLELDPADDEVAS